MRSNTVRSGDRTAFTVIRTVVIVVTKCWLQKYFRVFTSSQIGFLGLVQFAQAFVDLGLLGCRQEKLMRTEPGHHQLLAVERHSHTGICTTDDHHTAVKNVDDVLIHNLVFRQKLLSEASPSLVVDTIFARVCVVRADRFIEPQNIPIVVAMLEMPQRRRVGDRPYRARYACLAKEPHYQDLPMPAAPKYIVWILQRVE